MLHQLQKYNPVGNEALSLFTRRFQSTNDVLWKAYSGYWFSEIFHVATYLKQYSSPCIIPDFNSYEVDQVLPPEILPRKGRKKKARRKRKSKCNTDEAYAHAVYCTSSSEEEDVQEEDADVQESQVELLSEDEQTQKDLQLQLQLLESEVTTNEIHVPNDETIPVPKAKVRTATGISRCSKCGSVDHSCTRCTTKDVAYMLNKSKKICRLIATGYNVQRPHPSEIFLRTSIRSDLQLERTIFFNNKHNPHHLRALKRPTLQEMDYFHCFD